MLRQMTRIQRVNEVQTDERTRTGVHLPAKLSLAERTNRVKKLLLNSSGQVPRAERHECATMSREKKPRAAQAYNPPITQPRQLHAPTVAPVE